MTAALRIDNVTVSYGAICAVRDAALTVAPGEAVAVIGSNGAGKSSLLRGVMNLASRTGRITFQGQQLESLRPHVIRRAGIGYVPEGRELFPNLTVQEELTLGARMIPRADRPQMLEQVFGLFPRLRERAKQVTRTLSGGEQQMVAIARVLMGKPTLLLLDEPSLGLAPVIQDVVFAALDQLRTAERLSMLLVEQNAYRALALCSRAYVLETGTITREDSCETLRNDPAIRSAYLGH
ncbi:MAG: ABC transporter ATP-binding protein [Acetobacteraceae bacterium]|nr:ABC transporter ATP-binding protein [Pseudomonadota bacterium]